MTRLESVIGGKRVPLTLHEREGRPVLYSLCQDIARSAPVFVSDAELAQRLRKAGYWNVIEEVQEAPCERPCH